MIKQRENHPVGTAGVFQSYSFYPVKMFDVRPVTKRPSFSCLCVNYTRSPLVTVLCFLSHASPAGPARAGERHRGVGFRTDGERVAEWPPVPLLRAVEASAKRPHGKPVRLRIGG